MGLCYFVRSFKNVTLSIINFRHKDGVLYEHGPRTIRPVGPQGANTLAMVQELGLSDK